ncbi:hypothetical protein GCM10027514_22810 [Azotobacter armeniacus]
MKAMKLILAMTALTTASLAMAEINNTDAIDLEASNILISEERTSKAKPYKYGMKVDVAELIKVEYLRPAPSYCGVIPAEMTYKDSTGAINVVEYLYPDTSGCMD